MDANADGEADFGLCYSTVCDQGQGDNHAGYIGYRDLLKENTIDDDGSNELGNRTLVIQIKF